MNRSPLRLGGLILAWILVTPIVILVILYLFGMIYFDGPFGSAASAGNLILASSWLIASFLILLSVKGIRKRAISAAILIATVVGPWLAIRPSNDRDWSPEFEKTGWVKVEPETVTFHHFRNFDYDTEGNEIVNWETRTYHLKNLQGLDYFHDAFGGDLIAHPILSFDFGDEGHVCLSIETRREKTETFSTFGGLFKMFELQYIFGSEEDLIRVRTNVRDEPVYFYRTNLSPERAKEILLESIAVQNEMRTKPRWYNVLTANCTTSMRAQTPEERRREFDIRMLINGKLDEYLYEKGMLLDEGMSFPELRPRCLINKAAQAEPQAVGFSQRIREGRPGFRKVIPSP